MRVVGVFGCRGCEERHQLPTRQLVALSCLFVVRHALLAGERVVGVDADFTRRNGDCDGAVVGPALCWAVSDGVRGFCVEVI